MSNLEVVAVIFTLACVYLTVIRNVWCWPMGIIAVTLSFFLFYQNKLYSDMGLQVIYLVQSIYGWYFWLHGKKGDDAEVPIRRLVKKEMLLALFAIIGMIGVIGFLTSTFTDTDVAYLDATVASISLVANMLLARKIIDNWALWIFVDVIYVFLFWYKELYVFMGLYVVFCFMATAGLINWRKQWLKEKSELAAANA